MVSANEEKNLDKIWEKAIDFHEKAAIHIQQKRYHQNIHNMWTYLSNILMETLELLFNLKELILD
jgi:hypothetical protein